MALYANYVPNPSLELGVDSWFTFNTGNAARVGSNASSGSYSLKVSRTAAQNVFGGASITVPITPGGLPYTVSLYITGATEEHGPAYSAGTKVSVWDVLPGQADVLKALLTTQTFSRTTSGRVAIRNFTPRATADRIVVTIETASTYYQAQQTTQQTSGLVWWLTGGGSTIDFGGTTHPNGRFINDNELEDYQDNGWTLSGTSIFYYHETVGVDRWYPAKSGTFKKTVVSAPEVNGGESTVYIDALQLEQGTVESSYVDGSTSGYVWAGAPHNSATLNVAFLQAAGTATLSGPDVEMLLLKFMQAAGTSTLSGPLAEMTRGGTVRSSGTASLTGTAQLWLHGSMRSSGTASAALGQAQMYEIVPIEAHGTQMGAAGGGNAPHAEMRLAWDMWSHGTASVLTGTVEMTFPQPISADGTLTLSGTAHVDIGWQLSASGMMELLGQAQLDDATPAGAFADFVIYSATATDTDPLMLGIGSSNAGTSSGANGANWVRIQGEFMAPADQPASNGKYAWRRAAYAGVGFTFASVGQNLWQELACIQLEPSSADNSPGPRAYKTAKSVEPMVWADKINFATIAWWQFFGSTNLSNTTLGASPIPGDTRSIRKLTWQTNAYTGFFGSNIVSPPPNSYCIASFYARGTRPTIEARILNNSGLGTIATSGVIDLDPVEWTRVVIYFRAAEIEQIFCVTDPDRSLTYPLTVEIAGVMVERATILRDFFDFQVGTSDYFYRYNGTDPSLGVFQYKNVNERIPLLVAALEDHAPLSVLVKEPLFGWLPTLD